MDEALESYMRQLQKKGLLDADLDHDDVGQGEELTDAGVVRDKKDAGDDGGSDRSLRAGSTPSSPARHKSTTDRQWKFLCDNDIVREADGSRPERVLYHGLICGHKAGTRKGMPVEWSNNSAQPVYSVTVYTAVRVLSDVLRQNGQAVLQRLRKDGLEVANMRRY
jgi:hypothetical protein